MADERLRIVLDQAPLTLNPRRTLDLTGQRIGALLYRGLTQIDSSLNTVPDLAEKWEVRNQGKTWHFWIKKNLKDHAGQLIDANQIARCLEEYRIGKPTSPIAARWTDWKSTRHQDSTVIVEHAKPNPYFARELSALGYFTTKNKTAPCQEPASEEAIVGSGPYQISNWDGRSSRNLRLIPIDARQKEIHIAIVRDETSRVMKLLSGEADALQNGFSFTKYRWFEKNHSNRFKVFVREGVNVSYLAFNLKDPILSKQAVRLAIAKAIDRDDYVLHKSLGFVEKAGSLLSPLLPESVQVPFAFDPSGAEVLLEGAGFPKNKKGIRFTLHYKTTPVREGLEMALLFQHQLRRIGIELVLEVVEPAVFLAAMRRGAFQLCSSRWIGVADGSIFFSTLRSGQKNNRAGYQDPLMDQWLDEAIQEMGFEKRKKLLSQVQRKMMEDLPYFPLWYWTNAIVVRKELAQKFRPQLISLKGALDPLLGMR